MNLPKVRIFPDRVLRQKAASVKTINDEICDHVDTLIRVMKSQPHGIGIAAPQIGISLQIAVVDVSSRIHESELQVLINPRIIKKGSLMASREGCMSIPEYTGNLTRHKWIKVHWMDLEGKHREAKFSGIEGVCMQHEIDHLAGVMFVDRVDSMKRDMIPRKFKGV